jgi:hypothetical protein
MKLTRNWNTVALALLLVGASAHAQTAQGGDAPTNAPAPAGAADATTPDATLSAPTTASLKPAEMLAQAQDYRAQMNEALNRLNTLSEAARRDRDIIRLTCLSDKIAQVKANIAVTDQTMQSLQEDVARQDEAASLHDYTRLTILHQKVQLVTSEGDACVGADLTYVGQTRVEVQVTGNLPDDSITQPAPPSSLPGRPPLASPYF